MGYYHINDTGKGVIIKDFDNISKDYKMPPIDYIKEYFLNCNKKLHTF